MNFNFKENGKNKSFIAKPKHQYTVSQYGKHDCSSHDKNNGDFNKYLDICLISRMTIKYKECGGKKSFLANPKRQYCVAQCGEHDFGANNKKNGDYYDNLNLSHYTDEL